MVAADMLLTALLIRFILRRMRKRAAVIQILRGLDDSKGPVYIDGQQLMQMSKTQSPFQAAMDTRPLRTSTILVLMASVASAVVRYIVNILAML